MSSFGVEKAPQTEIKSGPYGVFTSNNAELSAEVIIEGASVKFFDEGDSWIDYPGTFHASGENFFIGS
jgi:hypothetical protein